MTHKSKYCSNIIKNHFNQKLVMSRKDDEDFENSTKCCIWDNVYVDVVVKVRYHHHITGKYRDSEHRDYDIKVRLNHIIPIVFTA